MINTIALTGRLTSDPELKTTDSGKKVCNFTLAVNDGYGDKQKSYFISCSVWNKSAENLAQYTKKGDLIGVEGKLTQRTYDLNESIRSVTEVVCSSITFLNTKTSATTNESDQTNKYSSYEQNEPQAPKKAFSVENGSIYQSSLLDETSYQNKSQLNIDEDDLPF